MHCYPAPTGNDLADSFATGVARGLETASELGDGAGLIPFVSMAKFLLSGLRRSGRHLVRILVVRIFASSSVWEGISHWGLRDIIPA